MPINWDVYKNNYRNIMNLRAEDNPQAFMLFVQTVVLHNAGTEIKLLSEKIDLALKAKK